MSERPDDDGGQPPLDPQVTEADTPIEVPQVTEADTPIEVPGSGEAKHLDDSDEQQVVYVNSEDEQDESDELRGPRFETQKLEETSELGHAYDCLQIRTPLEEFQTYAQARLETLVRLGEADRAQLTSEAIEAGLGALRHVMGAAQRREGSQ